MFLLLVMSTSSFTFLNFSKYAIRRRKTNSIASVNKRKIYPNSDVNLSFYGSVEEEKIEPQYDPVLVKREKILLFTYGFILSFTSYGILPGLQSYSTLPYGNHVFNYAVNIS